MSFYSDTEIIIITTEIAYNIASRAERKAKVAHSNAILAQHNNDIEAVNIAVRDAISSTNSIKNASRIAIDAALINTIKINRDILYPIIFYYANDIIYPFIISTTTLANNICIIRDTMINEQSKLNIHH